MKIPVIETIRPIEDRECTRYHRIANVFAGIGIVSGAILLSLLVYSCCRALGSP